MVTFRQAMRLASASCQTAGLPMTPTEINEGRCEEWANEVHRLVPEAERYWTFDHMWVRYRGRFYDAEARAGVEDWSDLPFFERFVKEHPEVDIDKLYLRWDGMSEADDPYAKMLGVE